MRLPCIWHGVCRRNKLHHLPFLACSWSSASRGGSRARPDARLLPDSQPSSLDGSTSADETRHARCRSPASGSGNKLPRRTAGPAASYLASWYPFGAVAVACHERAPSSTPLVTLFVPATLPLRTHEIYPLYHSTTTTRSPRTQHQRLFAHPLRRATRNVWHVTRLGLVQSPNLPASQAVS
jgi:hypothetical protein